STPLTILDSLFSFTYLSLLLFYTTATTLIYTLSLHDALPIFASHFFDLVIGKILTRRLSLSKHLAHNLGNLLLLGKIGVFHNRQIGRAVQQECRDRSRMPSSA